MFDSFAMAAKAPVRYPKIFSELFIDVGRFSAKPTLGSATNNHEMLDSIFDEASDTIPMDDNFSSIAKPIMWVRCVNDAVRKVLQPEVYLPSYFSSLRYFVFTFIRVHVIPGVIFRLCETMCSICIHK